MLALSDPHIQELRDGRLKLLHERIVDAFGEVLEQDNAREVEVLVPCCCDDPTCRKEALVPYPDAYLERLYLAPEHLAQGARDCHLVGTDGWQVEEPLLDSLGREVEGIDHPARAQLEQMISDLVARAGLSEPPQLVIVPGRGIANPSVRTQSNTIRMSAGLINHFAGRIELLDMALAREIAHLVQYSQGRDHIGLGAELEADAMGVKLSGRRENAAFTELLELCLRTDPTRGDRYPPLEERLAVINAASLEIPLVERDSYAVGF